MKSGSWYRFPISTLNLTPTLPPANMRHFLCKISRRGVTFSIVTASLKGHFPIMRHTPTLSQANMRHFLCKICKTGVTFSLKTPSLRRHRLFYTNFIEGYLSSPFTQANMRHFLSKISKGGVISS